MHTLKYTLGYGPSYSLVGDVRLRCSQEVTTDIYLTDEELAAIMVILRNPGLASALAGGARPLEWAIHVDTGASCLHPMFANRLT